MKNRALKDLKVLLVEDEESISRLLKEAVADSFYTFLIAKDGLEGIALFKKLKPDIVITDIMMPRMSGLEMAQELRKINPDIHIIVLSAFSEKEKLLSAIDIGINKYFLKPFDTDELLDYIQSITPKLSDRLIKLDDGFVFNKSTNSLYKKDRFVPLTKNEMKFLSLLLDNQESVIDDTLIKKNLWEEDVSDERVRTFIRRLRAKTSKKLIKNVKGVGYQLAFNGN
ncbi:MAG: response regulator transcription factor [Sulfurimonas sp.]|jgi:DNA-binding response OmpR family regulator|uniref:response regulator transcription factor n=1 Tax=unclassified Sulfurimonas TaxID=2623549 RepID=UPI0008B42BE1|nr:MULTISPECIES: response regulator transcription factor [unclassified Sulfurimonas]MBS4069309.1 response regulator transcription factor [Sulfurimonas sp.]MDD3855908.1 response regulator transcription factor [Sulfurimonas sp.]OHE05177.1 MAG: regulator [Sulfurimonas sp. RIFOXYB12_FULL_35_9]